MHVRTCRCSSKTRGKCARGPERATNSIAEFIEIFWDFRAVLTCPLFKTLDEIRSNVYRTTISDTTFNLQIAGNKGSVGCRTERVSSHYIISSACLCNTAPCASRQSELAPRTFEHLFRQFGTLGFPQAFRCAVEVLQLDAAYAL